MVRIGNLELKLIKLKSGLEQYVYQRLLNLSVYSCKEVGFELNLLREFYHMNERC